MENETIIEFRHQARLNEALSKLPVHEQELYQLQKLKLGYDIKISKFQSNTKWWPYIVSTLALGVSFYSIWKK